VAGVPLRSSGVDGRQCGTVEHASNVPQCALKIEEIFRKAGFPEDTFQTLLIGPEAVDAILNYSRIAAATLTGSEQAGIEVGVSAAKNLREGQHRYNDTVQTAINQVCSENASIASLSS
jgi:hypothetical protein